MPKLDQLVPQIIEMGVPELSDKKVRALQSEVRRDWKKSLDAIFIDALYEVLIIELDRYLNAESSGIDLYFYIETFSTDDYLKNYADPTAHNCLLKWSSKLIERIRTLIELEDQLIVNRPIHRSMKTRGNLGEMTCHLIELYFYHVCIARSEEANELKEAAASVILPFVKAFPKNSSGLINSFIRYSQDPIDLYTQIIHFYLESREDDEDGMIGSIALKMSSLHVDSSNFAYKNGPKVIKSVLRNSKDWDSNTVEYFLEKMFFYPLSIPISVEKETKELEESILFYAKLKKEDPSKKYANKCLNEHQKKLEFIKDNSEGYLDNAYQEASKKAAVSKNILKCVKILDEKLPEASYHYSIKRLIEEAEFFANKPKKYIFCKKPITVFKDFHFKLLVIEELMYRQKVLKPIFNIHKFAEEYTKREISVEEDGYEPIAEALKYFKQLDISEDKLNLVIELQQDGGVDGGAEFMNHVWPFWDPGCGDEVLPVSNKAISDLDLVPNLKKITGLENSKPSKKLFSAIEDRGILLVKQEL